MSAKQEDLKLAIDSLGREVDELEKLKQEVDSSLRTIVASAKRILKTDQEKPVSDEKREFIEAYLSELRSILNIIEERELIFILGNTGSGKSTFVNYIMGYQFKLEECDYKVVGCAQNSTPAGMATVDESFHSVTKKESYYNVTLPDVAGEDKPCTLVDFPGFQDTENKTDSDLYFRLFMAKSAARAIKAVVIMLDTELMGNKGSCFKNLISTMSVLLNCNDISTIKKNIIFVMNFKDWVFPKKLKAHYKKLANGDKELAKKIWLEDKIKQLKKFYMQEIVSSRNKIKKYSGRDQNEFTDEENKEISACEENIEASKKVIQLIELINLKDIVIFDDESLGGKDKCKISFGKCVNLVEGPIQAADLRCDKAQEHLLNFNLYFNWHQFYLQELNAPLKKAKLRLKDKQDRKVILSASSNDEAQENLSKQRELLVFKREILLQKEKELKQYENAVESVLEEFMPAESKHHILPYRRVKKTFTPHTGKFLYAMVQWDRPKDSYSDKSQRWQLLLTEEQAKNLLEKYHQGKIEAIQSAAKTGGMIAGGIVAAPVAVGVGIAALALSPILVPAGIIYLIHTAPVVSCGGSSGHYSPRVIEEDEDYATTVASEELRHYGYPFIDQKNTTHLNRINKVPEELLLLEPIESFKLCLVNANWWAAMDSERTKVTLYSLNKYNSAHNGHIARKENEIEELKAEIKTIEAQIVFSADKISKTVEENSKATEELNKKIKRLEKKIKKLKLELKSKLKINDTYGKLHHSIELFKNIIGSEGVLSGIENEAFKNQLVCLLNVTNSLLTEIKEVLPYIKSSSSVVSLRLSQNRHQFHQLANASGISMGEPAQEQTTSRKMAPTPTNQK